MLYSSLSHPNGLAFLRTKVYFMSPTLTRSKTYGWLSLWKKAKLSVRTCFLMLVGTNEEDWLMDSKFTLADTCLYWPRWGVDFLTRRKTSRDHSYRSQNSQLCTDAQEVPLYDLYTIPSSD